MFEKYPFYTLVAIQSTFIPLESTLSFTSFIAAIRLDLFVVVNSVIVPL